MYPQDHPLKTLPAVAVPADDSARLSSRKTFLTAAGWADAKLEPFAEDASFRRYFRLRRGSETLLLMDAPPPHERVAPFADIAEHLLSLGFPRRSTRATRLTGGCSLKTLATPRSPVCWRTAMRKLRCTCVRVKH